MKTTLLFSTLAIGLALTACERSTRTTTATDTTAADNTATAAAAADPTAPGSVAATSGDSLGNKIDRAGDRIADASRDAASAMRDMGRDMKAKMSEWRLSETEIRDDVQAGRPIVRTRTDAPSPTGNVDEDTLESAVKGRLQADSELAGLSFDVNASKNGEVELEGKARTATQIAHAMAAALGTDGVTKVTSRIKLDGDAGR